MTELKKKKKTSGDLKILFRYIGKFKKFAILSPIIVACEAIIEVLIPTFMSKLINDGIGHYLVDEAGVTTSTFVPGEIKYVFIWGAVMVVLALISMTAGFLAAKCAVTASQGFAMNLRKEEFKRIQDFSFANIDKFSTASLVTRMTTDVTNTAQAFQMMIRLMVRSPLMLIFALIMAINISPAMSIMYAIAVPVIAIVMFVIMYFSYPTFQKMLTMFDNMNASVQEDLIGIRVVKAFVREDYEIDKFTKTSKDVRDTQIHAEKIMNWSQPMMQLIMYVCLVCIALFGGQMVIKGTGGMKYADLTAFLSYTTQILMSLIMISMFFVNFVMSRASMKRIAEVIREVPDIKDDVNSKEKVENGNIDFKDACFSYSKDVTNLVLDHINISIKSGSTVGIIGGTGSSKSTFVQLIPRLYDVLSGEVLVGDKNVKVYSLKELRNNVAMVLQKNVLFSGTIKDNLRWGNENATDEEIVDACKKAQADTFINEFPEGYNTDLGQGGVNVSGGQKQRICIARALLKNPKILILDDSTSAVDTATDATIRSSLKSTLPNVTKIIIAQRIASIMDADQIIVLDNGKIVDIGNHDELYARNQIYQEVYNSQMKGAE